MSEEHFVTLPAALPVSFTEESDSNAKVTLPVTLPISFLSDNTYSPYVTLPVTLPMFLGRKVGTPLVKLPITLPMKFSYKDDKHSTTYLPYRERVNLNKFHGTVALPYKETAIGQVTKVAFKERGWYFPGLILSENVITSASAQLNLVENVQALILVDFELLSTNTLQLSWYGHTVPSLSIMKKSAMDETYTESGLYNWDVGTATVDIESEDYNIYLKGSSNSGTSAVYTVAGVDDILIDPTVDVLMNDKIYAFDIDYVSVYTLVIDY